MNRNWEYKKLGDVCDSLTGLWTGKKEPFVNVAVIRNTNFSKNCKLKLDDVAYLDVEQKQYSTRKLLPGDIIVEKSGGSDKQPVGRVVLFDIPKGEFSFSNFTGTLRIKNKRELNSRFLHRCLFAHYLRGETRKLQSKTTGLHNLDMKGYLKLPIPVLPLEEQSRIVAELVLLTGIIDKQNAQLKELDNLAQAVFYDMFGDPIENSKGWEVKKLGTVAQDIFAGGDKPEDCSDQPSEEYCYPVIAHGVGDRGVLGYAKEYRVGVDAVTIGARGASIGNCRICKAYFTPVVRLITIIPGINFDIVYLFYAVQLLNFNINGAGQAQLTVPNVKSQNVVVPPLALQQSFAEKIQSIEKQKETIRASIADTQKLLDYTMDKYFG